jgi:hypothetical protein
MKMVQARLAPAIVVNSIALAPSVKFDLSPGGLVVLKSVGASDAVIQAMINKERESDWKPNPDAPEKSQRLATSNPDSILRNFKTMAVNASQASFFGTTEMKAALGVDKDFQSLGIVLVEDPRFADVILEVAYTFAWDYPFALRHQNSSVVLVSGKGTGPFSAPLGAKSVAEQLAKSLKAHRAASPASAKN